MNIAVTDANIFIDLLYLQIQSALFNIGLVIYTTQNVIDELNDDQVQSLQQYTNNGKLIVYAFSEAEIEELTNYSVKRGLSIADHSVLYLVERKIAASVISGDNLVRKTCRERNLEVHGVLWLFDEFIKCAELTHAEAVDKLAELMLFNKRLPIKTCEERLDAWRKVV